MPVSWSLSIEQVIKCFQHASNISSNHFISGQCFKQKSHQIILHQPCYVNPCFLRLLNNPASKTRTYSSFVATTALRTSRSKSSRCTSSKPLLRAISKPTPATGETVMNMWKLIGDGKRHECPALYGQYINIKYTYTITYILYSNESCEWNQNQQIIESHLTEHS